MDKYNLNNPWSRDSRSSIGSWVMDYEMENVLTSEVANAEGWRGWNFVYNGKAYEISGYITLEKDKAYHVLITNWDERIELPENFELRRSLCHAFRVNIQTYAAYRRGDMTEIKFDNRFMADADDGKLERVKIGYMCEFLIPKERADIMIVRFHLENSFEPGKRAEIEIGFKNKFIRVEVIQ